MGVDDQRGPEPDRRRVVGHDLPGDHAVPDRAGVQPHRRLVRQAQPAHGPGHLDATLPGCLRRAELPGDAD